MAKKKNRFKHVITTIIGTLFLLFGSFVAIDSYLNDGTLNYMDTSLFLIIGMFFMFAKDDLINQVLRNFAGWFGRKYGDPPKEDNQP